MGNLRNRIEYYEKQEETRAESPGPDADTQNAMLRLEYQLEKQAEQTQGLGERVDGIDGRLREVLDERRAALGRRRQLHRGPRGIAGGAAR